MLDKKVKKGKTYSVYCSPDEIAIIDMVKERISDENQLKVSNSEILKMAIRKLGEEYEK